MEKTNKEYFGKLETIEDIFNACQEIKKFDQTEEFFAKTEIVNKAKDNDTLIEAMDNYKYYLVSSDDINDYISNHYIENGYIDLDNMDIEMWETFYKIKENAEIDGYLWYVNETNWSTTNDWKLLKEALSDLYLKHEQWNQGPNTKNYYWKNPSYLDETFSINYDDKNKNIYFVYEKSNSEKTSKTIKNVEFKDDDSFKKTVYYLLTNRKQIANIQDDKFELKQLENGETKGLKK